MGFLASWLCSFTPSNRTSDFYLKHYLWGHKSRAMTISKTWYAAWPYSMYPTQEGVSFPGPRVQNTLVIKCSQPWVQCNRLVWMENLTKNHNKPWGKTTKSDSNNTIKTRCHSLHVSTITTLAYLQKMRGIREMLWDGHSFGVWSVFEPLQIHVYHSHTQPKRSSTQNLNNVKRHRLWSTEILGAFELLQWEFLKNPSISLVLDTTPESSLHAMCVSFGGSGSICAHISTQRLNSTPAFARSSGDHQRFSILPRAAVWFSFFPFCSSDVWCAVWGARHSATTLDSGTDSVEEWTRGPVNEIHWHDNHNCKSPQFFWLVLKTKNTGKVRDFPKRSLKPEKQKSMHLFPVNEKRPDNGGGDCATQRLLQNWAIPSKKTPEYAVRKNPHEQHLLQLPVYLGTTYFLIIVAIQEKKHLEELWKETLGIFAH